jgi:hypothetical protein
MFSLRFIRASQRDIANGRMSQVLGNAFETHQAEIPDAGPNAD